MGSATLPVNDEGKPTRVFYRGNIIARNDSSRCRDARWKNGVVAMVNTGGERRLSMAGECLTDLRGRKMEFIGCARSCIQCSHAVDERGVRSVQTKVTGSQQSYGVRNITDAKHIE